METPRFVVGGGGGEENGEGDGGRAEAWDKARVLRRCIGGSVLTLPFITVADSLTSRWYPHGHMDHISLPRAVASESSSRRCCRLPSRPVPAPPAKKSKQPQSYQAAKAPSAPILLLLSLSPHPHPSTSRAPSTRVAGAAGATAAASSKSLRASPLLSLRPCREVHEGLQNESR
ncbi:hypothetical protein GUJ93_ZPchr0010g7763 [Zizania palustris]|uniref:Uncharacterized protein n=1 Tax=Zizania palustris TaxID=103762 RepID=A0A8J5W7E2_ZIZPA|nr:hypothetical protein GUJ93_ZPchr0010g7763 [Zizania palustris]